MKRLKHVILLLLCFLCLSGCNQENGAEIQEYIKKNTVLMLL